MPATSADETKGLGEHKHLFELWTEKHSKICRCGKRFITSDEYDRRKAEWDNYFELSRNTPAGKNFGELREAFKSYMKTKNQSFKEKINEILKEVSSRGHWGKNEYGDKIWVVDKTEFTDHKPSFPDPVGEAWKYIVGNI